MHLLSDILGRPATDIDTPALVIDLDAMERNLARMAAFAVQQGVQLRPHAKMHKSAALAQLQMAHGAVGVRGGLLHGTVEQLIKVDARGALT